MGTFIKAISQDGFIRAFVLDSTDIVERAHEIHASYPVCTALLGRALTAASIMGAMQKGDELSLTLQIKGGGPAGPVVCVSDAKGNVKGYLSNPFVDLPLNAGGKLDVAGAVGRDGYLAVIRDLKMKEPYSGQVPIVSGEIAEDITNYFAKSEQIPTACALGVLVEKDLSVAAAGGYLIQLLPGAPAELAERVEGAVYTARGVSSMIADSLTPEQILEEALPGIKMNIVERTVKSYVCDCCEKRVLRALISLGKEELTKLASEQKEVEIDCYFCGKKYSFKGEELLKMI